MKVSEVTAWIGELIATEMDDVNRIEYLDENIFLLVMENGRRFQIEITIPL